MACNNVLHHGPALLLIAAVAFVASCGLSIGPITGPEPGTDNSSSSSDLPDSTTDNTASEVTCSPSANSLGLARSSGTPGGVLTEPVSLVGTAAQFTSSTSNVTGEFGTLSAVTITVTSGDTSVILVFRAGTATGRQLRTGLYFTDAFASDNSATANPTVRVTTENRQCSSQTGDVLEILDLDVNALAGVAPEVKRFWAVFELDCVQGCVSFVDTDTDTDTTDTTQ